MSEHPGQPDAKFARPSATRSGPEGMPHPDVVTAVIQHEVRAGAEAHYEAWLQNITVDAQRFPGHLGVNIIRPPEGSRRYTIVLRFDILEHLQEWFGSETRRQLIAQVEPLLGRGDQVDIKTGWDNPDQRETVIIITYQWRYSIWLTQRFTVCSPRTTAWSRLSTTNHKCFSA